jgi:hypothetical protein
MNSSACTSRWLEPKTGTASFSSVRLLWWLSTASTFLLAALGSSLEPVELVRGTAPSGPETWLQVSRPNSRSREPTSARHQVRPVSTFSCVKPWPTGPGTAALCRCACMNEVCSRSLRAGSAGTVCAPGWSPTLLTSAS